MRGALTLAKSDAALRPSSASSDRSPLASTESMHVVPAIDLMTTSDGGVRDGPNERIEEQRSVGNLARLLARMLTNSPLLDLVLACDGLRDFLPTHSGAWCPPT
jgi:hypothetical protein